jgi:hypothetical protein
MKRQSGSIAQVAVEILQKEKHPLHYREITKRLLRKCHLGGRTPHETVRSRLGTDSRFKRVAEGVYALAEWEEYPVARFAKDIAYDILKSRKLPITLKELGERILRERQFKGAPSLIGRNSVKSDPRFYIDQSGLVSLSEWKK